MILTQELKRAVLNKKLIFIIIVGILIYVPEVYKNIQPYIYFDMNAPDITPEGARDIVENGLNRFNIWFGAIQHYTGLMVILVGILYASSYFDDLKSKFINFIGVRVNHRKYVFTKYIVNGIAGGVAVTLPCIIFTIITMLAFKGNIDVAGMAVGGIFDDLLKSNVKLFFALFFCIQFLFGFAYATMALAVSSIIKNKIAIIFFPIIYYFIMGYVTENLKLVLMRPAIVAHFAIVADGVSKSQIFIQLAIIIAVSTVIYFIFSRKAAVYE